MKPAELIEHVAKEAGVEKKTAKKVMEVLATGIVEAAKAEDGVMFPGLGRFVVKDTPARTGRNPTTGEPLDIAASRKLSFKPAKGTKDAITS